MTTILIACAAALAATVLVTLVVALGRGSRGRSDARLDDLATRIDGRLDAMARDLEGALERAREGDRRGRLLGELGGTLDLDEALLRTVAPAGRLHGVGVAGRVRTGLALAAPALDDAGRLREARRPADLDALTGLHNRRYFHETLRREVARAQRYGRGLALMILDVDDFKAVNDRIGHLAGDGVLAEAADRVRDVVRSADVACRIGGDEFAVILPEARLADADRLYRRLEAAVSSRPLGGADGLHLSAGVTELRPDDDAISFFERADDALYRAKGKGTVVSVESPSFPREAPGTAATT